MQLNGSCVIDIMVAIKDNPDEAPYTIGYLCNTLQNYSGDDILACCLKLEEEGYLEADMVQYVDEKELNIRTIERLTASGYSLLERLLAKKATRSS